MSGELPPLPDDLRALLDAATPPAPPSGFEARVLAKVGATLGWPGGPGGGEGPPGAAGGDGGGPSGGGAGGGAGLGTASAGGAAAGLSAAAGAVTLTKTALTLGAALLLGAGVAGGVVLGRTAFAPEVPPKATPVASQPVVAIPPPVTPEQPEVVASPPEVKPVSPTPRAQAPKKDASPKAEPTGARDTELSAERALLEVARTALAKGDVPGTLEAVERHAREFPRGRLAEEREVLFIQALAQAGRRDEALARAQRFRAHFPDSLMLPAVDAALAP
ncbi:MAG: hypothetical protein AMXMBFR34_21390 [Myxococcaceae bacterium]